MKDIYTLDKKENGFTEDWHIVLKNGEFNAEFVELEQAKEYIDKMNKKTIAIEVDDIKLMIMAILQYDYEKGSKINEKYFGYGGNNNIEKAMNRLWRCMFGLTVQQQLKFIENGESVSFCLNDFDDETINTVVNKIKTELEAVK